MGNLDFWHCIHPYVLPILAVVWGLDGYDDLHGFFSICVWERIRMAVAFLACVRYLLFDELQPQRPECTVYLSGRRGDDWFFYCAGAGLDA